MGWNDAFFLWPSLPQVPLVAVWDWCLGFRLLNYIEIVLYIESPKAAIFIVSSHAFLALLNGDGDG